jgi:hypothetical protein
VIQKTEAVGVRVGNTSGLFRTIVAYIVAIDNRDKIIETTTRMKKTNNKYNSNGESSQAHRCSECIAQLSFLPLLAPLFCPPLPFNGS